MPPPVGTDLTKFTVMSVGTVPWLTNRIVLKGLPKLRALPPPTKPVRLTLPMTSVVPLEVAAAGIVSVKLPVFRLPAVRVSAPVTVASTPSETPATLLLLIVRLLKVVGEEPPIVCAALPLKLTVLLLAVKVPLLVQLP